VQAMEDGEDGGSVFGMMKELVEQDSGSWN